MNTSSNCTCPNRECPNHGNCSNCASRHLRLKTLNHCAFHSILPLLNEVLESPLEEGSSKIMNLIDKHTKAYNKSMAKHNISKDEQELLLNKKSTSSPH